MMGKGRPAATTADMMGGQRLWLGAWLVDKLAGQRSGCVSTLTGINSRFLHRHASRVSLNVFTIITEHKNPVSVVEHSRLLRLLMRTELLLMATQAHVFKPLLRRILTPFLRVWSRRSLRLVRARLHQDQSNVTFKCLFCGGGRGHASSDASHPPTGGNNTDGDRNTVVDEQKTRQQQQSGGVDGGPTRLSEQDAETLPGGRKSRQRTEGTRASVEGKVGRQTPSRDIRQSSADSSPVSRRNGSARFWSVVCVPL